MGCRLHFAACLLAAAMAAGAEPQSPPPFPWVTNEREPAGSGHLRGMHACCWDMPRLFARIAPWSIRLEEVLRHAEHRLCDPELVVRDVLGDPAARELSARLWDVMQWARRRHGSRPSAGLTDLDVVVLRRFIEDAGYHLVEIPWDKPSDMHAYVSPASKEVALPGSRLTETRRCDRSTVLHEMTHFFQLTTLPRGGFAYCREPLAQVFDSCELAAYVVEVAERVRQGWTVGMFEENDRSRDPRYEAAWVFDDDRSAGMTPGAAVVRPRVEAALLVQYVSRYGPQLTGDMALDLRVLRAWVARFETFGLDRYSALPPDVASGWRTIARLMLVTGAVDPLASTLQTWLASQGAPTALPEASPPPGDHVYFQGPEVSVWPDVPAESPEAEARAQRFLERLRPQGDCPGQPRSP